jgi:hypothetical protein
MVMGCDGKLSATALPPNDMSAINADRTVFRITPSDSARTIVIARSEATKQSNFLCRGAMDCFAALAMTAHSFA